MKWRDTRHNAANGRQLWQGPVTGGTSTMIDSSSRTPNGGRDQLTSQLSTRSIDETIQSWADTKTLCHCPIVPPSMKIRNYSISFVIIPNYIYFSDLLNYYLQIVRRNVILDIFDFCLFFRWIQILYVFGVAVPSAGIRRWRMLFARTGV